MPYFKVVPQESLGRTPLPRIPQPVFGKTYVRGTIPLSIQRRLRTSTPTDLYQSPVYSQFRHPRRWEVQPSLRGFGTLDEVFSLASVGMMLGSAAIGLGVGWLVWGRRK